MSQASTPHIDRSAYLPGMGLHALLPLYDPIQRMLGVPALHRELIDRAGLRAGDRVLDVGCGTGNLLAALARRHPATRPTGIDPDPRAVDRARRKLDGVGMEVRIDEGLAQDLPYPDASFDRVLSSLMFHHLEPEVKSAMLAQVRRVLSPRGTFTLLDFGGVIQATDPRPTRWMARSPRIQDNLGDAIPDRLRGAGFAEVTVLGHTRTRFVPLATFRAVAPDA